MENDKIIKNNELRIVACAVRDMVSESVVRGKVLTHDQAELINTILCFREALNLDYLTTESLEVLFKLIVEEKELVKAKELDLYNDLKETGYDADGDKMVSILQDEIKSIESVLNTLVDEIDLRNTIKDLIGQ